MRRRGMREHARRWACGAGPGRVAILRGWDVNGTAGARRGGRAGPRVGGRRGQDSGRAGGRAYESG
jgi:hypothetical protein